MTIRPLHSFEQLFARLPETVTNAPGRVNLIGEHTDYNGGFVLPTATPQRTYVELAAREDHLVRASSADMQGAARVTYVVGEETKTGTWLDYVQGVTHVLRADGFATTGFDARITSTVPLGAGLSSSAALCVSLLRALRHAFALPLEDMALAKIAQRVETDFLGAPIGLMDPVASSLCDTGHALFFDTRTGAVERIALPRDLGLVVIDSGVHHAIAGTNGDGAGTASRSYHARRRECDSAARLLGVHELRDVHLDRLTDVEALPSPFAERARHVVLENARVLSAVDALKSGGLDGLEALGTLFNASHTSMRDDFDVSERDVDTLVAIAQSTSGVFGARMTGGGFGGAIVAAVHKGDAAILAQHIAASYADETGREPRILMPPPP